MLGATAQVKYKCIECGIITEKETHCCKKTVYHAGIPKVDNDAVNIIANSASSVVTIAIISIIFSYPVTLLLLLPMMPLLKHRIKNE